MDKQGSGVESQGPKENLDVPGSSRDIDSPALLAPHTSGPRDVPRCGALSLLQKTPHYRGGSAETAARLNVKLRVLVTDCLTGGILLLFLHGI